MRLSNLLASLLVIACVFSVSTGGQRVKAQEFRVEVGGGWAIPSSEVDMDVLIGGAQAGRVSLDPGSGRHAYASAGLTWTISTNFSLGVRLRAQQSQMSGDADDLTSRLPGCATGPCEVSNDPDGRLRAATLEGRIILRSVHPVKPYFLVGLGVVQTSVDGVRVTPPDGAVVRFEEAEVTDAGGDVGFGALWPVTEGLSFTAEVRVTGSLPGAKENAITTFPFSVGVSYGF